MKKHYYYSFKNQTFNETKELLEYIHKKYKNPDVKVYYNMTNMWIISNKDLLKAIYSVNDLKSKYKELDTKPTPTSRWMGGWVDYRKSLEVIEKIQVC